MFEVVIQTPLILDGLERCSNRWELRREKPGRELLTLLIVTNLAMWLAQTFQVQLINYQYKKWIKIQDSLG
jgi:hypothetical protein